MRQLLAAIRFLTILPLPGTWGTAEDDLARSVAFFPLVGLLLGAAAAAVAWGLALVAPPMVTAAVLVIVLLGFSGGLHIDGLSDTADGFLSCRSREQMLEIMKDSHAGPMGLVAVVCVLLLKFAALSSIALLQPAVLWPAVLLMPLAGRSAVCINLAILPSARPDGLGAVFCRSRHHWAARRSRRAGGRDMGRAGPAGTDRLGGMSGGRLAAGRLRLSQAWRRHRRHPGRRL